MDRIVIYSPEIYENTLKNLRKIPFAKDEDGYRFAYWVYDLNNNEEMQADLLRSSRGEEAAKLVEKAKQELSEILVTEDDYLGWTIHKKETGGIKKYHKILHDLSIHLLMLTIDRTADEITEYGHAEIESFYTVKKEGKNNDTKLVLNKHNPFADVTIKSQQFFYKTENGDTETLFFNTNDIVEKVDKNGHDMLTMHPGFSVSKEYSVVQRPMQKVMFANSMTESIIEDEDHIYIHID